MSKYLVTGGAGFVGSHLTDYLVEAGHDVVVVDNFSIGSYEHPESKIIKADITDINVLQPLFDSIDGCFHLVAIPSVVMDIDDWFGFNQINLQSSLNVFKSAIQAGGVPVVYASSCAVYGNSTSLPLHEEMFVKPLSSYGCDKLSVELNAHCLSANYGLPTLGLRFFNVYGPRQDPRSPYSGVISRFITRILNDESPIIYGDGSQTRDFIYVKDIAKMLMQAMSKVKPDGEVVNLCTGIGISINELASQIARSAGKHMTVAYQPKRSYDVQDSVGSTIKMHAQGFKTRYDLAKGLSETIAYMGLTDAKY